MRAFVINRIINVIDIYEQYFFAFYRDFLFTRCCELICFANSNILHMMHPFIVFPFANANCILIIPKYNTDTVI